MVGAAVIPTYQVFLDEEAEAPRNRMVCLRSTHCLGCGELRRSQGARCAWTSSPHTTRGSLGGQLPAPAPPDPLEVIMGTASAQKLGVEQLSRHFPMQGPLLKSSRFRAGFQGGSHRSLWPGVGGALTQSKFLQELGPLYCAPGSDQSASPWRSVGEFCLVSQRKKEQHKTKTWCDMKGLW